MRHPLLSIVGPTATGKTQFALRTAEVFADQFHVFDLISADSRQVFKQMEVGTGADIPAGFTSQILEAESGENFAFPFYKKDRVRIHGVSITKPSQEWSVAQFREFSQKIILAAWQENNLPILVGGTGLYHQHVLTADEQIEVPPNQLVRENVEQMSLANVQRWLKELNQSRYETMNNSDQHNPRRLIRGIEQELALQEIRTKPQPKRLKNEETSVSNVQQLMIGLSDSIEHISQRIEARIHARLGQGMLDEVQKLIADYDEELWKLPAFSATGFKEVRAYMEDKLNYQQMQALWLRREVQYAKRQMTWWKKQHLVHWFDVSESNWQQNAIAEVQNWIGQLT